MEELGDALARGLDARLLLEAPLLRQLLRAARARADSCQLTAPVVREASGAFELFANWVIWEKYRTFWKVQLGREPKSSSARMGETKKRIGQSH